MSIEVLVPNLPESVADATLLNWHKQAGDRIQRDENLVDLETDKVVLEVPAPADGVLTQILRSSGESVTQGQALAIMEEGGNHAATKDAEQRAAVGGSAASPAAPAPRSSAPPPGPSARRALAESQLSAAEVAGSGKEGRVTRLDVERHVAERTPPSRPPQPSPAPPPPQPPEEVPPRVTELRRGERPEQRVPMTRLRARIAERLVQAQRTAAILTTFNEVDLQAMLDIRTRYQQAFEETHEIRLGLMSFFVKACVEALRRFPIVNASVDGEDVVYHGYFDVGIAVDSPRGLVVPILRDADQLSFAEIEKGIAEFTTRARDGSLGYEELTGGTFTISNGGIFGSMLSTPILNPPQSAILGMHRIQDRPAVVDGSVVIRPMMYLALSYDHRIIDGRDAVQFLVSIKRRLEDPAQLMLDI